LHTNACFCSEDPKPTTNADESNDDISEKSDTKSGPGVMEVGWMTAVKDWAGVMISAQTLIGRILVRKSDFDF